MLILKDLAKIRRLLYEKFKTFCTFTANIICNMNIQATKLELIQQLLTVKQESVLIKIKEILSSNSKEQDVVAHTTSGEPLTVKQYKAKIQRGIDDIKANRVTSVDDLEKEIKTW